MHARLRTGNITELFPGAIGAPAIACGHTDAPDITPRGKSLVAVSAPAERQPARQLSDDEIQQMDHELFYAQTGAEVREVLSRYEHDALS